MSNYLLNGPKFPPKNAKKKYPKLHITLQASIGARAISAKNSAEAEAARYSEVL